MTPDILTVLTNYSNSHQHITMLFLKTILLVVCMAGTVFPGPRPDTYVVAKLPGNIQGYCDMFFPNDTNSYKVANWLSWAPAYTIPVPDDPTTAAKVGDDYAFKAMGKVNGGKMYNDKEADVEVWGDMTDVDIANGRK